MREAQIYKHVAMRCSERYGIGNLSKTMWKKLGHRVRTQDGIFLFRCRRKKHLITYLLNLENKNIIVGYNAKKRLVNTVLPIETNYKRTLERLGIK